MNSDKNNPQLLTQTLDSALQNRDSLKAETLQAELSLLNKIAVELKQRDLSKTPTDKLVKIWFELKETILRDLPSPSYKAIDSRNCDSCDLFACLPSLDWLKKRGRQSIVLQDLYQRGPKGIRIAEASKRIVQILVEHGHLCPILSTTEHRLAPSHWEVVHA